MPNSVKKCSTALKNKHILFEKIIALKDFGLKHFFTEVLLKNIYAFSFLIFIIYLQIYVNQFLDWNLDNTDGLNPKLSPYKLYRKAIKGSKDMRTIILLMHCTCVHKNTCEALPQIIEYYKSQGYEFKTLTNDTPELYFPMTKKTFNLF